MFIISTSYIIFLALKITAMFASQGNYLIINLEILLVLIIPFFFFYLINFIIAQTVEKYLDFSYEDTVSMNFTVMARNTSLSLAIAVTVFSDHPLIVLTLIVDPLVELPILAVVSQLLLSLRGKIRQK